MLLSADNSQPPTPQGHVNNTVYNKWAESARVNWLLHFAALDPANAAQWRQLMTMKHIGFIMQSITTKYKMVSPCARPFRLPLRVFPCLLRPRT